MCTAGFDQKNSPCFSFPGSGRIRMRFAFLLTFLLQGVFLPVQAQDFRSSPEGRIPGILIKENNNQSFRFVYQSGKIALQTVENTKGLFYRIKAEGLTPGGKTGSPEIPLFVRTIEIPKGSKAVVRIENPVYKSLKLPDPEAVLYPRQPSHTKTVREKAPFFWNKEFYLTETGSEGEATAWIEREGIMRGKQLGSLFIKTISYEPGEARLRILESAEIQIDFLPDGLKSKSTQPLASLPQVFTEVFQKNVLNYTAETLIPEYAEEPMGMIILSDSTFEKTLQPFIRWKRQIGYSVTELYRGKYGLGNSFTEIKDSLQQIYDAADESHPAPVYLLLAGDEEKIPVSIGSNYTSDLYWAEFDGEGDYLPDMLYGRLPARDSNELKNILRKSLRYEQYLLDENTYQKALLTTGNDAGNQEIMNYQIQYAAEEYINVENGFELSTFYYPMAPAQDDSLKTLINSGLGFLNYTGHGMSTELMDPEFTSADAGTLDPNDQYGLFIVNACQTARFSVDNSLGEALLRADSSGAAGYIGCSYDSYWSEDFFWAVGLGSTSSVPSYETTGQGAYDGLFHTHNESPSQWYTSFGQIIYAGNMAVMASTSQYKQYYWETYHLLGDPSLIPFLGDISEVSPELPDTLPSGMDYIYLDFTPFTYAAISSGDTLWDAGHLSPNGNIQLALPAEKPDSALLVITGQNLKPVLKTVYFSDVEAPYIQFNNLVVNDSEANANGQAENSETIGFNVEIENLGTLTASDAYLKIQISSPWAEVLDDSVFLGDLLIGTLYTPEHLFSVLIADSIPDQSLLNVQFTLHSDGREWSYSEETELSAPIPRVERFDIDDSASGNNNHLLEAGENFDLLISYSNIGHALLNNAQMELLDSTGFLNVIQSPLSLPDLPATQSDQVRFSLSLDPETPPGQKISFYARITAGPYQHLRKFTVTAGLLYEGFETLDFSTFNWIPDEEHPWFITTAESFEEEASATSDTITHNQRSSLRLMINMPERDSIFYLVKVSSEPGFDKFRFLVNEEVQQELSGETNWVEKILVLEAGQYELHWEYEKDESVSKGYDRVWLDYIRFPENAWVQQDLRMDSLLLPTNGLLNTNEELLVKVINTGQNTITDFTLSYQIDGGSPTSENINHAMAAGEVYYHTFSSTVNMNEIRAYQLKTWLQVSGDEFIHNDSLNITVQNLGTRDMEIRSLISPHADEPYQSSETVSVWVKNAGNLPSGNFHLAYSLNGSEITSELMEVDILPGDSLALSMSQTADMSKAGTYDLLVFVSHREDQYHENDTLRQEYLQTVDITDPALMEESFLKRNPVNEWLEVSISPIENEVFRYYIFDLYGKKWQAGKKLLLRGKNDLSIPVHPLPTGSYFLRIDSSAGSSVLRFIKE